MQKIIDKILSGDLSQKNLIEELIKFNDESINEYNEACDVNDANQLKINKLEADARQREANIVTIEKNALIAVDYAKSLESANISLKADNKDIKQLRNENKSLKKLKANHAQSSKKQLARIESLTKDCKDYREQIAVNKSDIARLRLTGMKTIGKYSFTIFPSKTEIVENGKAEKQVNLVIMDSNGNLKIIGVNKQGEIAQPRSHNFKLEDEHIDFITSFDRVAKADKYQFTSRVLQLVN